MVSQNGTAFVPPNTVRNDGALSLMSLINKGLMVRSSGQLCLMAIAIKHPNV